MDGWNTTFLLERPIFRGYVSFREGIAPKSHSNFGEDFFRYASKRGWSFSFSAGCPAFFHPGAHQPFSGYQATGGDSTKVSKACKNKRKTFQKTPVFFSMVKLAGKKRQKKLGPFPKRYPAFAKALGERKTKDLY